MDRRHFIVGTLSALTGSEVIVKATAAEVAAFGQPKIGETVGVNTLPRTLSGIEPGSWVYNHKGERIGVVRGVSGDTVRAAYELRTAVLRDDRARLMYSGAVTLDVQCLGYVGYEDGLLRVLGG